MAFSVTYGEIKDKEIIFDLNSKKMNYTDFIKQVCDDYFIENSFFEDDEEVSYRIIKCDDFLKVCELLNKFEKESKEECINSKGNEKKNELTRAIHDCFLLQSIIVEALIMKSNGKNIVLTLV